MKNLKLTLVDVVMLVLMLVMLSVTVYRMFWLIGYRSVMS